VTRLQRSILANLAAGRLWDEGLPSRAPGYAGGIATTLYRLGQLGFIADGPKLTEIGRKALEAG
jgi:hypothetical protein